MLAQTKLSNARHHPPRTQRYQARRLADESDAIRGRVHAVVRRGATLNAVTLA